MIHREFPGFGAEIARLFRRQTTAASRAVFLDERPSVRLAIVGLERSRAPSLRARAKVVVPLGRRDAKCILSLHRRDVPVS